MAIGVIENLNGVNLKEVTEIDLKPSHGVVVALARRT